MYDAKIFGARAGGPQIFKRPRRSELVSRLMAREEFEDIRRRGGRNQRRAGAAAAAGDREGHEFAKKAISGHARQAALQQPASGQVVGDDAGEIKRRAAVLIAQAMEHLVSAANDGGAIAGGGVE